MTGPNQSRHPDTGPDLQDDLPPGNRVVEREPLPLSRAAVAALVFGIIGGLLFAYACGVVALFATGKKQTRRGRGLAWTGIALATVWLVGLVVFAVWAIHRGPHRDADGQITKDGVVAVTDLRAGDCLRDPGTTDVSKITVVPCQEQHHGQVIAGVPLSDGAYDATELHAQADASCSSTMSVALSPSAPQDLQLITYVPDAKGWNSGHQRTALCVVVRDFPLVTSVLSS